ncbi:hypothetical protein [Chryseobacterium sp. NKUCC03_KSP]|uniref:hypothetical protein n=1 Tax=Chryseobacterium sp. NKUCC03_KSP TaxID=2842125 RepID=UPI001C5AF7F7|nr:hypothetical protein [Chryseobacterium sp. NKUCC03_KSP]MBW3523425.1 hypothetical protein [Chryseobacterium sp. NKUCC03_KSP]
MENNKNFKKEIRLVKSVKQAKTVLNMLLQDSEKLNLEKGISGLLEKLENPKLDLLLDRYPELLQEYVLEELLSGELEITDVETSDVKTAGLFSCLQLLIHFCYELKENPNPNDNCYDSLRYILSSISSGKFVHDLLIIVVSVVGIEYYEKFQQRIQSLDLSFESAKNLENDSELQEYIDLMAWFALVRLFLESVYTYFNIPDQNFNNRTL